MINLKKLFLCLVATMSITSCGPTQSGSNNNNISSGGDNISNGGGNISNGGGNISNGGSTSVDIDDKNPYYDSVNMNLKGASLKTALANKISNHTSRSYDQLWSDFRRTDARDDGTVWDMYSNEKFRFGNDQCGNYSVEGDCYNREHSFPKSWFNDAKPMYTDLFHLVPTDGKVNGMRSNYPFGEVASATYTSKNGSKLGRADSSIGYSGTVFEPVDQYKGDFARIYFYMATAYESKVSGWNSPHFAKNTYPTMNSWSLAMFKKWSSDDPVSEKEINRNNAVYSIQGNRNPYVDFPGLENIVWNS